MENREGQQFKGSYIPQELLKEIQRLSNRLTIGIPRETEEGERRLALTPEAVEMLTGYGHRVLLESGAGLGINYSDNRYAEAGATFKESTPVAIGILIVKSLCVIVFSLNPGPSEPRIMANLSTLAN